MARDLDRFDADTALRVELDHARALSVFEPYKWLVGRLIERRDSAVSKALRRDAAHEREWLTGYAAGIGTSIDALAQEADRLSQAVGDF